MAHEGLDYPIAIACPWPCSPRPHSRRGKKPADVQILETKAVRDGAKIKVDGKVRVTGEKPLHGLVIVFDFRSPEKEVVTSQKAVIDEETHGNRAGRRLSLRNGRLRTRRPLYPSSLRHA